jgi:peptide/nickel transport system substrate-binding protein
MTRLRWAGGLAFVLVAATACGMGGGDDSSDTGGTGGDGDSGGGGHLVFASQFAPAAAWAVETDDAFLLTRMGCMETLVMYDFDGSLQPGLAESWEQSAPTEWTFTLRPDVTFQDGTAMDAEAVAGALNHVLEAPTPARSVNPETITSVEASDASTVVVTTPAADVLLPYRMASPNSGILAPKAYEGQQIDIIGTCTGPFAVTAQNARQSVDLEANADYWGGEPQLASAEMRFVVDGQARVTQLQAGEAHIIESFPPNQGAVLSGDDNVEIVEAQEPRTTSLLLNTTRPPFDDPLVRQAIQHAVDTQTIADAIYDGAAVPAIGPFAPDDPWAPEGAEAVALDPAEAESLFSQAGVDPGSVSFELIAYNDRPEFADLATVLQDQLGELGIEVSIKTGEYASFEPDLLAGEFDAALLSRGYLVDVGDPAGYLSSDFTCEGGYNIAHYCNPDVDTMVNEAIANEDTDARYAQYAEIGEMLQADAAGVFLVHNTQLNATAAGVEGYELHPLSFYDLTADVSLSE